MRKEDISAGKYQHYKGQFYEVLGVCRHSETLEEFVIYKALYNSEVYGEDSLWVRPLQMFCELVECHGQQVPRFRKLS